MTGIDRRHFFRKTAAAGGMLLAPSLTGLIACADRPTEPSGSSAPPLKRAGKGEGGYGELIPCKDVGEIISLPKDFHAAILSTAGAEMAGGTVPYAQDGMSAFADGNWRVRLVCNHELRDTPDTGSTLFGDSGYDEKGPGGTTTLLVRLHVSGRAELIRQHASLAGTFTNCAGGATPWRTWISSEEAVNGRRAGFLHNHGYNFEVEVDNDGLTRAVPLKAMGRFEHEAVAVDPNTGIVYQTEDRTPSGFYRFIPDAYGRLRAGGKLQVLAIEGKPQYNTMTGQERFSPMKARWIRIPEPDSTATELVSGFVFNQGLERGAAQFARLEGCWYADRSIFFNATSGGDAGAGQVWQYHIGRRELQLIFESPSTDVLNSPDNITVSPRGGLVICEDGTGVQHLRGLTRSGEIFDLARNDASSSEWAGACFSPQGRTLFVNLQGETRPLQNPTGNKGITLAIWGPWERGAL